MKEFIFYYLRQFKNFILFQIFLKTHKKASPVCLPKQPITLIGFFTAQSGLGESVRGIYEGLIASGFRVNKIDITDAFSRKFKFRKEDFKLGEGTVILHVNPPELPYLFYKLPRFFLKDKYIIGYWLWELSLLPVKWQKLFPYVNEIWTSSQFNKIAFSNYDSQKTIRVIPPPYKLSELSKKTKESRCFTVFFMFDFKSSMARKNPLDVIKAFKRAFGHESDKRLILKTQNSHVFEAGWQKLMAEKESFDNIYIFNQTLSKSETSELLGDADVVLSLHRSEGFGLMLAEAMIKNIPVIATNYSANIDFLNETNSYPIKYQLIAVKDEQQIYSSQQGFWAQPNVEDAALNLRYIFTHQEEKTKIAQDSIKEYLSLEKFAASAKTIFILN